MYKKKCSIIFFIFFVLSVGFFVPTMFCDFVFAESKSFFQEPGGDFPDVYFFPADEAQWDGYSVTIINWRGLTSLQKFMFLSEAIQEIERNTGLFIEDVDIARLQQIIDQACVGFSINTPDFDIPLIWFLFELFDFVDVVNEPQS